MPAPPRASSPPPVSDGLGAAGRIARVFIDSKLTPLLLLAAVLLGAGAVMLLPREEEPQIRVPMIDVFVAMPGAGAHEVEERVVRPMEKLLWEIPGVEYIYSTARPGEALSIVRFEVGEDVERALVRLNQKLQSNFDRIPHGVSFPLVKARSIDDVPILALTFHSSRYDAYALRRLAVQVDDAVKRVSDVAETALLGGLRRQVRVLLDPARLAARNLSPMDLVPVLRQANRQDNAGGVTHGNREVLVETGGFLRDESEVADVVVAVSGGRPVYLREVADIVDGPEEATQYVVFGKGAATAPSADEQPAVTLTVAKRPGTSAIAVARRVLEKVENLRGAILPRDVEVTVTRNYAQTAEEKSDELLLHMAIAVFGVSVLILLVLGWRESLVVATAIPATLALTLLVFYLSGFTLNRVTLFALIFSIGILVDDAIVVVENIARHFHLPANQARAWSAVAVEAVNEVGNPTILATWAVIAAVLPMAFVGGMMGPYMRPIPIGSTAAMLFSLAIAFVATPWASIRVLRWGGGRAAGHRGGGEDLFTRIYRRLMEPLIARARWRRCFLGGVAVLLAGAAALVPTGIVKVKMLPFDNKSELQIILNMPEGSALEYTVRVTREIASAVRREPEVRDYQIYAGIAAPFNFNGLVRHYFLRRGANVADIQVNLVDKRERKAQSHEIAKRIRQRVAAIAARYGARVAVAEVPPGPPVLQTLVAEIYGPGENQRLALAREVTRIFSSTPGVVDVDWYIEADQPKARLAVDREKAALHGISAEAIASTLRLAASGLPVDLVHMPREKEDVELVLELPRPARARPEQLLALRLRAGDSARIAEQASSGAPPLVPLRELVQLERAHADKSIYHKNLRLVTYVVGDVAGEAESPVYAILRMNEKLRQLDMRRFGESWRELPILNFSLPFDDQRLALKWDGEWHVTIEVFRDLGIAFAGVLVLIYGLMVGWFRSFLTPVIVMVVIPFSLIGILPAHGAMGAFFTATSMIGFMAGAGIVVRNSIILVDFIELRRAQGLPLAEAVVEAGAVRFRPMLLTAMAVVVGAAVILFDPIFQGLAVSLMAGEVASLLISRMAVPLLYYAVYRR